MNATATKTISLKEAVEIIDSIPNGRVFTVEFLKRTPNKETGEREMRKMNCRKGVRKGVKGVGRSFDPRSKGLIGVFDMQIAQRVETLRAIGEEIKDDGHRLISIEGIKTLNANGERYEVVAA
jgi:hypothetical protein